MRFVTSIVAFRSQFQMAMPAFALPRNPIDQNPLQASFLNWVRPLDSNNIFFAAPEETTERDPDEQGKHEKGDGIVTPPDEERFNTDFEGDRPNQG